MTNEGPAVDAIETLALLADRNRRRVYELVAASREPVGRDDVAAALGVSRELAAFHLDRLLLGGLLMAEYRRRNGRRGPGAGRPAKLYRRAEAEVAVSFPPRRYEQMAEMLAEGLDRPGAMSDTDAVTEVARERGTEIALEARRNAGPRPSHRRRLTVLIDLLRQAGYEPDLGPGDAIRLRNCPYHALVANHPGLTCGMNLAWAKGVATALDSRFRPELAPQPDRCCVVFQEMPGGP
ncbi:MAG: transcriptional regulator [Candidatus Limnocylindria bacterium]